MLEQSNELAAWDRDHFFHPSTHMGTHARGESPQRVMASGEGVYITDTTGRKSLDAFAGLYCVNVGYGRQKIADAIAAQAKDLAYYHAYVGHGTEASIALSKMIIDRAPKGMSRVYFGLSGSDANETNIKLIWYYNNVLGRPEKKKIISRWRGYHGSGVMTGSLTGLDLFHNAFDLPRTPILHTEAPYFFRREDRSLTEEQFSQFCADKLEEMILAEGSDTVAAFIGEPILGTGGIVPPPAGYWAKIQAVLQRYDVLLVADEVVTGFGRLGTMFGSDRYGIRPDLITIAKGLTSAYAPLSGVIVSDKVWQALAGVRQTRLARPWLDLFRPPDLRCRRRRQSGTDRRDGPREERRRDRRLFPRRAGEGGRRPQKCRRRARRRDAGCGRVRRGQGRPRVLRRLAEGRATGGERPAGTRSDRPRHAARRHPRLRTAALPDA
jgi:L-2,4-diaminobutyrate transaminase